MGADYRPLECEIGICQSSYEEFGVTVRVVDEIGVRSERESMVSQPQYLVNNTWCYVKRCESHNSKTQSHTCRKMLNVKAHWASLSDGYEECYIGDVTSDVTR